MPGKKKWRSTSMSFRIHDGHRSWLKAEVFSDACGYNQDIYYYLTRSAIVPQCFRFGQPSWPINLIYGHWGNLYCLCQLSTGALPLVLFSYNGSTHLPVLPEALAPLLHLLYHWLEPTIRPTPLEAIQWKRVFINISIISRDTELQTKYLHYH